jgi:hypothetical protein
MLLLLFGLRHFLLAGLLKAFLQPLKEDMQVFLLILFELDGINVGFVHRAIVTCLLMRLKPSNIHQI